MITATDTRPVNSRLSVLDGGVLVDGPCAWSWLFGQLTPDGHPRPEFVRRTAAPVTMMIASSIAATIVIRRYAIGLRCGTRMARRSYRRGSRSGDAGSQS